MPLLAAALLAALAAPWHPEWGPPPPVAPYGNAPLPNARALLPMVHPLVGPFRYADGYGARRDGFLHTGEDLLAPKMTPIVAPISGVLGFKRESFWIWGDDGWAVLGTHLNDDDLGRRDHRGDRDVMFAPDLVPGQRIERGRLVGYVGRSGDATAPHLHFELYAPGPGGTTRGPTTSRVRDPLPSLKAAARLARPTPSLPAPEARPRPGELRLQGCVRRVDPGLEGALGTVTLLLTAEQEADGRVLPMVRPRYVRLRVAGSVAAEVGGWDALARAPRALTIAAYVSAAAPLDGAAAVRLSAAPYALR